MSEIRRIVKPGFWGRGCISKFGEIFPIFWGRKNYNICWKKTVIDDDEDDEDGDPSVHPSPHPTPILHFLLSFTAIVENQNV
jgi:hypothetical protein